MSLPLIPSCTGCGACCLRMTLPPVMTEYPEDATWWRNLPGKLKAEIEAAEQTDRFLQPCIWLDLETRQCRNYEHRPPTCREFVPGCEVCLEDRESARRDGLLL